MPFSSIGPYLSVVVAGTPVRITAHLTAPAQRLTGHTLFIQQHPNNLGALYFMSIIALDGTHLDPTQLNKATGVGVLVTIPAPTLSGGIPVVLPWMTYTIPFAPGDVNVADYYLDADNSGDKATVSLIVA